MTEKLKVSREVADVLDSLNRKDISTDAWLKMHLEGEWVSAKKPLNTLSLEEFATALIVGYEVEMTPREYVTKHYNIAKRNKKESLEKGDIESAMLNRGVMAGIKRTLRAFQITVEGVNDDAN